MTPGRASVDATAPADSPERISTTTRGPGPPSGWASTSYHASTPTTMRATTPDHDQ